MRMKRLLKKYNDMKYRYKLTILLVVVSLVPMTVLALYSHSRMSSLVRKNEMEDMYSILEQTRENIDGQIEIYASLLNYLTYSPEIQEVIQNKDMDRYTAYEQYTEVVDPLLTVPKSYHEAILGIQLFAESIPVRHEYTLAPLSEVEGEWWSDSSVDRGPGQPPDRSSPGNLRWEDAGSCSLYYAGLWKSIPSSCQYY